MARFRDINTLQKFASVHASNGYTTMASAARKVMAATPSSDLSARKAGPSSSS